MTLGYFLKDQQRFTSAGYRTYWEAIDRTVRYFDSIVLKKQERMTVQRRVSTAASAKPVITTGTANISQNDCHSHRFKWRNPAFERDFGFINPQHRLPTPPPKC